MVPEVNGNYARSMEPKAKSKDIKYFKFKYRSIITISKK